MRGKKSLHDIITAAVNDLAEHGYDSAERVAYWTDQIRAAAQSSMKTTAEMAEMLQRSLTSIYRRLVERGGVLKMNPSVARFTLERVQPTLRAELDRRMTAARNLIKLNREETVEKTIRRFQGWATSIPPGGSAEPEKKEAKDSIRKGLAGLPFVERRVLIDQGRKLGAAINLTVAEGGGAIAGVWKSNFRQPGYDYREDHKERDGHILLIRDSWAQEKGFVKPGDGGYMDGITQPAEEPFCRCRYLFLFHLRQMPDEMLTAKGREELKRVKVNA